MLLEYRRVRKFRSKFLGHIERVIERIGKVAYRLELLTNMKMHPIIRLAHLEPAPDLAKDPLCKVTPTSLT